MIIRIKCYGPLGQEPFVINGQYLGQDGLTADVGKALAFPTLQEASLYIRADAWKALYELYHCEYEIAEPAQAPDADRA